MNGIMFQLDTLYHFRDDRCMRTTAASLEALSDAPFSEYHSRTLRAPIDAVWPHCLAVTAREIRTFGPLIALRTLPARMLRREPVEPDDTDRPLLDIFVEEGFVLLRRDESPRDGRATAQVGAAGRFWSPSANAPIRFDDPQAFLDFDTPGYAKTVARIDAIDLGDGTTRVETETIVAGTDRASTRKFAPYWALIRLPSGLIRRSWLAAIDRRVASR